MKKITLSIITLIAAITINAQTYVGQKSTQLISYKIAANELVYVSQSGNILNVYNTGLQLQTTMNIPSKVNCKSQVSYISRTLFDNDNAIEYLVVYYDTINAEYPSIGVVDNNVFTAISNFTTAKFAYPSVINTSSNAQLKIISSVTSPNIQYTTRIYNLNGLLVGIKKINLEAEPSLYPNPTNEYIHIRGKLGEAVHILDINGKLVYNGELNDLEMRIDVSNLMPGNYFVQTASGDNWKFVKE